MKSHSEIDLNLFNKAQHLLSQSISKNLRHFSDTQYFQLKVKKTNFVKYHEKLSKIIKKYNEENTYNSHFIQKFTKYNNFPNMTQLYYLNNIQNTFRDLIIQYKNKNYKIPKLTTDHNVFRQSPLLEKIDGINGYYYNCLLKTNKKIEDDEKNIKYMAKLSKNLRKRINKINGNKKTNDKIFKIKNVFGSTMDEEYYYKNTKEKYVKKINEDKTLKKNMRKSISGLDEFHKYLKSSDIENIFSKKNDNIKNETENELDKEQLKEEINQLKISNEKSLNLIEVMCSKSQENFENSPKKHITYNENKNNIILDRKKIKKNTKYRISRNIKYEPLKLTLNNDNNNSNSNLINNKKIKKRIHLSSNSVSDYTNTTTFQFNSTQSTFINNSNKKITNLKYSLYNIDNNQKKKTSVRFKSELDVKNSFFPTQIPHKKTKSETLLYLFKNSLRITKDLKKDKNYMKTFKDYFSFKNKNILENAINNDEYDIKDFMTYEKQIKNKIISGNVAEKFKRMYINEYIFDKKKNIINKEKFLDNIIKNADKNYYKSLLGIKTEKLNNI